MEKVVGVFQGRKGEEEGCSNTTLVETGQKEAKVVPCRSPSLRMTRSSRTALVIALPARTWFHASLTRERSLCHIPGIEGLAIIIRPYTKVLISIAASAGICTDHRMRFAAQPSQARWCCQHANFWGRNAPALKRVVRALRSVV